MPNIRLIARLDIKGPHLIKSIQMEGVRKLGDPNQFAKRYYDQGIDEILYVDAVASLYDRAKLVEIVKKTAKDTFVPITVGGGIRTMEDALEILRAGADKIAINTAAIHTPDVITDIAQKLGSQCVVLSVQAKSIAAGKWEAYCDGGREHTGRDLIEWVQEGAMLGAGEILLTSVDREGTQRGFDVELIQAVTAVTKLPVIASGGMGTVQHMVAAAQGSGADAFAMAHILHYDKAKVSDVRDAALAAQLDVRTIH